MNKPPDNLPHMICDKNRSTNFQSAGPKYLIMSRINSDKTLKEVSPFLLKKTIDYTCGGTIEECKKLRNGTILIKTINSTQATKLLTLTALSNEISVEVTEHKSLNYSKGVIYCNDLRGIPEAEILSEMKSQGVIEVKKILKKSNEVLMETGLIILTVESTVLPDQINIGYQKINIRPYIPLPMRCRNCFKYGHTIKNCKSSKICGNCANLYHLEDETHTCTFPSKCSNCSNNNITPINHPAYSRACPTFIKQKELQAIKTTNKIDHQTATKIYNERHGTNPMNFSSAIKSNLTPSITNVTNNTTPNTILSRPGPRPVVCYDDIAENSEQPIVSDSSNIINAINKAKIVKIYPKNTPKRLIRELKEKNKK